MKNLITSLCLLGLLLLNHPIAHAAEPQKTNPQKMDSDMDGLSDWQEANYYQTDPKKSDTDGDGHSDQTEISHGFSPHNQKRINFTKRIEVDTKKQELAYFFDNKKINTFKVSTGKATMPTPKGQFKIKNKYKRAWSKKYGLWMPFWMGLKDGSFGFHELPEWPNGYKEGKNHLGRAVSHGCIRLGVGQAELLYNWAEVNTPVIIK